MNTTYVSTKDVKSILAATFPDYRKKQVGIDASGKCAFFDLNWSGGTRSQYVACTLAGKTLGSASNYNAMAPWDPRQIEGQTVDIPPGCCIVRAGTFCGKPSTATIYVNPADMPKLLPQAS